MQLAAESLQEADKWSTLSADIGETFKTQVGSLFRGWCDLCSGGNFRFGDTNETATHSGPEGQEIAGPETLRHERGVLRSTECFHPLQFVPPAAPIKEAEKTDRRCGRGSAV